MLIPDRGMYLKKGVTHTKHHEIVMKRHCKYIFLTLPTIEHIHSMLPYVQYSTYL